jgi:hypothetical protein
VRPQPEKNSFGGCYWNKYGTVSFYPVLSPVEGGHQCSGAVIISCFSEASSRENSDTKQEQTNIE